MDDRRFKFLVGLVLALTLGVGVGFAVDDDGDGRPDRFVGPVIKPSDIPAPAAVAVDGPDADAEPDDARIELDREAREVYQNAVSTPEKYDLSGGLRGTDENGPVAQHTGPLATPNLPGCQTRILPTNWSNRAPGVSVRAAGVHYTAGLNRPGWSDMNGLAAYASSPAAGVSWHVLIDAEGHCYYMVPLGKKAWTIGNLNSATDNIEVIGTGREQMFPAAPIGQMRLSQVLSNLARIRGYPVRLGAVSNCSVTRSGIITHWMGGACSGGHVDIKPYDLNRVIARVRAYRAAQSRAKPDTKAETAACRSVAYHRGRVRRGASWSDRVTNRRGRVVRRSRHASAKKAYLRKRGVREARYCRGR